VALNIFRLQYEYNEIYKIYIDTLGVDVSRVSAIQEIPFLPVQFFKTNTITTTQFNPEVIFESSGTTGKNTSHHYVKHLSVYKESFMKGFNLFYGEPRKWCILALLPGYSERQKSSLVTMVDDLIKESNNAYSGFYLDNHEKLYQALLYNETRKQPALLIGVTFALLDFAEKYSMKLRYTTVMETGGMKGRQEEITREEIHKILQDKLGVQNIHSEYGMTELLSQAYSTEKGLFQCPPWMKILIREENDPFGVAGSSGAQKPLSGLLNIIDLANLYSCSFIATDDAGKLFKNGSFEVLGRRDTSDLRGCSLLTAGDY
jgi:phenylacetate-coenzyme A ligase PaaK-like adenylate-forming protein